MTVKSVLPGQSIQSAIDSAQPGDRIILDTNADYTAPADGLVLPVKSGEGYISIESSRYAEIIARTFYSLRPTSIEAAMMARIRTQHPSEPVIRAAPGAHHYKLLGLDLAPKTGGDGSRVLELGSNDVTQDTLAKVPYAFVVDKCWIHAASDQNLQRGIALNSGESWITNNWISDCHGIGYDTQAIGGYNGTGPYHIINNLLEGAGENVMFGGADPKIPNLVPVDIEIRRNYFYKPLSWQAEYRDDKGVLVRPAHPTYAGFHWTVKNLFEIKAAKRVIVDGNVFENHWVDAQAGWAILIKVQNQDGGCTGCVTEDVTFSNNIIKNVPLGLNMAARDPYVGSGQLKRVQVINNLWLVNGGWFQGFGGGKLPDGTPATDGADGVVLEHNTHLQVAPFFTALQNTMTLGPGGPTRGFVYKNNLGARTGYGIKGDAIGDGVVALDKYTPGWIAQGNVLAGASPTTYPAGNFYPATWDEVKLGSDYRLTATSPFKGKATDGKDPGCDMDALLAAQNSAQPTPTPVPTPTPTPITPSLDGTKGATIIDSQLAVWTVGANGETLRNGVQAGSGKVIDPFYKYFNKVVYGKAKESVPPGLWYQWLGTAWAKFGDGTQEPGITPAPTPTEPQYEFKKFRWPTDEVQQDAVEAQAAKEGWTDCYPWGNWLRCKRPKQ